MITKFLVKLESNPRYVLARMVLLCIGAFAPGMVGIVCTVLGLCGFISTYVWYRSELQMLEIEEAMNRIAYEETKDHQS